MSLFNSFRTQRVLYMSLFKALRTQRVVYMSLFKISLTRKLKLDSYSLYFVGGGEGHSLEQNNSTYF
ncbi:hypothetical protein SK128_021322 [Halocaridina rubra]|uniref:Uncharacterized protein n=1 Tax=Halocaridina rubra TaxID=373956 RepID=A0AAN8WQV2_HALRR